MRDEPRDSKVHFLYGTDWLCLLWCPRGEYQVVLELKSLTLLDGFFSIAVLRGPFFWWGFAL